MSTDAAADGDGAADASHPLAGVTVLEVGSGIAAGYFGKLFVDAGATVVKIEPPEGDALRIGARVVGAPPTEALFRFLAASKRSVVLDPVDPAGLGRFHELAAAADIVIAAPSRDGEVWPGVRADALAAARPDAIVVTVTPFGLTGPWAGRAANEFTLQGWCGSIAGRGVPSREPVAAGGRLGEWATGLTAAVAALGTLYGVRDGLPGDLVDVSMLEVMTTLFNGMHLIAAQIDGRGPAPDLAARTVDVPSIEPTADGWVGFATNATEQFRAFAELCGRTDWLDDPELARADRRQRNRDRIEPEIVEALRHRRAEDVLREAEERRIPVAPVGNGERTPEFAHLRERGVFVDHPGASFRQPVPPYRLGHGSTRSLGAAPELGADQGIELAARVHDAGASLDAGARRLPLDGLRVFDLTGYWAGPYASQILGFLGAHVIKVESVQRPDGTRMGTSYASLGDRPWELAPLYHGNNTGKDAVTLDLTRPAGRDLGRRLLATCDVLIENFSPRVVERFGLLDHAWEDNPRLVAVRIPAFGLTGPWRERSGFAQNMEQATGLAWVTGYPDDAPIVPKGPCDPIGGLHATFAALVALFARRTSGLGQLVEAPLVESALNVAAPQVIDHTAYGYLWGRQGNRGPLGAPQGVYATAGDEEWLAVSVEDDAQWAALCGVLGRAELIDDPRFADDAARRVAHDDLDTVLSAELAGHTGAPLLAALWDAGVPVAALARPRAMVDNEQMQARGFFTPLEHAEAGVLQYPGFPARWTNRQAPLHRGAPPLLGEHSRQLLAALLGCTDAELDAFEADAVIGTHPV